MILFYRRKRHGDAENCARGDPDCVLFNQDCHGNKKRLRALMLEANR